MTAEVAATTNMCWGNTRNGVVGVGDYVEVVLRRAARELLVTVKCSASV